MLEAIEKRSDPVKVHKIATEYFKTFRSERGLIEDEKLNKDTKNDLESTSEELEKREIQKHTRVYIISLYEKYTGNQWRVGDDEFYKSDNLQDVFPEIIEAAIIASVLRSKTKINSFAYVEGAIHEFQENLPIGYLSYLRENWREKIGK
jgi:hypothetical protein